MLHVKSADHFVRQDVFPAAINDQAAWHKSLSPRVAELNNAGVRTDTSVAESLHVELQYLVYPYFAAGISYFSQDL